MQDEYLVGLHQVSVELRSSCSQIAVVTHMLLANSLALMH